MAKQNKYLTHVQPKLKLIIGWARRGAIDEDIARNLNVGVSTFSKYKNEYPELKEALSQGKEEADITVESALYKRAVGYEYDEITYEGSEEVKRVRKHVAGDTTAQIFWLKNRRPDLWRDVKDIDVSGELNNPFEGLTKKQLEALANAEIKSD